MAYTWRTTFFWTTGRAGNLAATTLDDVGSALGSQPSFSFYELMNDGATGHYLAKTAAMPTAQTGAVIFKDGSSPVASAPVTPAADEMDAVAERAAVGLATANLDTQLAAIAGYIDTEVAAIKAKTDNLPASPAAVGSAMTLTSGERDAVAAALLDLANAIETGYTLRQALRLMAATLAGKASGAGMPTNIFRNLADTKDRVTATVDASGNRTAVVHDTS